MTQAKARAELDYICGCPLGSPRPGYVIWVPRLHSKSCYIRKKLAEISYTEGDMLNG
jgi:hypothetical protein